MANTKETIEENFRSEALEKLLPSPDAWKVRSALILYGIVTPLSIVMHFSRQHTLSFMLFSSGEIVLISVCQLIYFIMIGMYFFGKLRPNTLRSVGCLILIVYHAGVEWFSFISYGIEDDSCSRVSLKSSAIFVPFYVLAISGLKMHIFSLSLLIVTLKHACVETMVLKLDGSVAQMLLFRVILLIIFVGFNRKDQSSSSHRADILSNHVRLSTAKMAVEVINRAKSNFLMVISHELRTPLALISAASETLNPHFADKYEEKEKQKAYIVMVDSTQSLKVLINDILDVARIESADDSIPLILNKFNIRAVTVNVIRSFEVAFKGRNVALSHSVDSDICDTYIGDADRIKQMMVNLLSNSMKFTETGYVKLHIRRGSRELDDSSSAGGDDVNDHVLQITVEDSGRGISEEGQRHLFEKFFQTAVGSTRDVGGTGLGLFIVRHFARQMGGNAYLDWSEEGKGSIFVAEIQLQAEKNECGGAIQTHEKSSNVLKSVLIVEDNVHLRFILKLHLETAGHLVTMAADGIEAVDAVVHRCEHGGDGESGFDMILMDLQMPNMDGYESARLISDYEHTQGHRSTPIIYLTATTLQQVRRNNSVSHVGYLMKPVTKEALLQCVASGGGTCEAF